MHSKPKQQKKTRRNRTPAPPPPRPAGSHPRAAQQVFRWMLRQGPMQQVLARAERDFYDRIFTPVVTLWAMIFQRLQSDHSLQAAVTDLHAGGADALFPRRAQPLSARIKSLATAAFSKARARLPLHLLAPILATQADAIRCLLQTGHWHGLRVLLMDGSQVSLRPHPRVLERFSPSANQHGSAYWVLMRVVGLFCLHSGLVVSSAVGATTCSEQALLCGQLLPQMAGCLLLGDCNFGIWRVAQSVLAARAHGLFRLTEPRAAKLAGSRRRLRRGGDVRVDWKPSLADRRGTEGPLATLPGRLLVAPYRRPGFRVQWIYLFTTLLDTQTYTAARLLELYAARWQVELNLRYLKAQMDLEKLDCQSADMAEKEWMAGLMAYNLIRTVMLIAAQQHQVPITRLSFSAARGILTRWLLGGHLASGRLPAWTTLLLLVFCARLPRRTRPRPAEPRAKRHRRETFPPLRGSRDLARRALRTSRTKS